MPHSQGIGAIFGIVAEDGVIKVGSPVRLYDRTDGRLIKSTTTAADGGYVFNALNPYTSDYMVLATDEDGDPKKNALVHDRVTPIPASQGSEFYANWLAIVRKYNPILWASATPKGDNVPCFPTNHPLVWGAYSGGVTWDTTYTVPSSPALYGLKPTAGSFGSLAGYCAYPAWYNTPYGTVTDNNGCKFSTFAVMDMGAAARWGLYYISRWTSSYVYIQGYVRVSWNGSTLKCEWRNDETYGETFPAAFSSSTDWSAATFNLGAMTGLHSVNIAWFLGGTSYVFVDGVQVGSFLTANTARINYSYAGTAVRHGFSSVVLCKDNFTVCDGNQVCYAHGLFPLQMNDAQAIELHNGFFTVQTPLVTGFAKECLLQGVNALLIPNAGDSTQSMYEFFSPAIDRTNQTKTYPSSDNGLALYPSGTPLVGQPSPIVGASSIDMTNGCYSSDCCFSLHTHHIQYEFMVYRTTTAAPTADEYLYRVIYNDNNAYSTVRRYAKLGTNRRLTFYFNAAVNETISPLYTLPDNTWVKISFYMQHAEGTWQLFINDALQETGATAGNAGVLGAEAFTGTRHKFEFGGLVNNSNVSFNRFKGRIAYLAIFTPPYSYTNVRVLEDMIARTNAMSVV